MGDKDDFSVGLHAKSSPVSCARSTARCSTHRLRTGLPERPEKVIGQRVYQVRAPGCPETPQLRFVVERDDACLGDQITEEGLGPGDGFPLRNMGPRLLSLLAPTRDQHDAVYSLTKAPSGGLWTAYLLHLGICRLA